ncbi:hypothetical protein GGX14DRAFT_458013, partial [Mycena pura]
MFSKSTCLALFVLAFSTFSAQAAPAKGQGFETETFCNTATIALSTVVSTVTSTHIITTTASSAQSTGSSSSNNGGGNNNFNGGGSNAGQGNEGNNGGNGNDSSTTTAAASSTTTSAAAPAGDNSGGGAATGSGSALDPNVVCSGFSDDGQNPPTAGQTASSTSTNNYINFCALTLPATPLTNGEQITSGSCNPAPIGLIPSTANMPSAKFQNPPNFGTIPANTAFTIDMALQGMQAGIFTNAQKTYFAAPQQLNAQGQIKGHSHFVVEALDSLDQTTPTDPTKFVFFKGIDDAGTNGVLSTPVTAGVPAGAYRICSINSSSNHQPVIVPIAQHGSLDDCIYFTASDNAANATSAASASAIVSASASAVESASASAVVSAAVPAASSGAAGAAAVPAGAAAVPAGAAAVPAAAGKAGAAAVPSGAAAVPAGAAAVPAGKAAVPTAKGAAVPTAAAAAASVPAKAGAKGAAAAAAPAASSAAAAATASGKGAAAAAAAAVPASGNKNNNKAQGKGRRRL